jgi:ribonuclease J
MPVHGEAMHLRAHADLAKAVGIPAKNIFLLEAGDVLLIDEKGIELGEPVDSGIVYVDGLSVGDVSAVVLKDRQTLAKDGIITVVCMVRSKDNRLMGKPEVIMRGVSGGDDQMLFEDLIALTENTIAKHSSGHGKNPTSLRKALREAISSLLWERCRRQPMVIPLIMDA